MDYLLYLLPMASFLAGFVDSIVGGGGLVQLPVLMVALPGEVLINILATNKLVSMSGTALSTFRFSKHLNFQKKILFPTLIGAFFASFLGAYCVSIFDANSLKPVFLILFLGVFIFTLFNRSLGLNESDVQEEIQTWKPLLIGILLGFYDGFFGPGTGSFLIVAFVGILGMTFVQGSGYAKMINLGTNLAAIILFSFKAKFLFKYAIPMIFFNMAGAYLGVRMAILRGNEFVRILLRFIIFIFISKLAFDILK